MDEQATDFGQQLRRLIADALGSRGLIPFRLTLSGSRFC